jgi:hypothetical protein
MLHFLQQAPVIHILWLGSFDPASEFKPDVIDVLKHNIVALLEAKKPLKKEMK